MSEPEVEWVTGPEGTLRTLTRGEGEDRVFLPALGGSYELYEPFVAALARTSRVAVIETLGQGGSDELDATPSVRALAEQVWGAADALGLERFDLVGLSLGGMVAQWVAGLRPERVRSLVLASTAPRGLRGVLSGDLANAAMAFCLLAPDEEQVTQGLADHMLEGRPSDPTLERVAEAIEAQPATRAALVRLSMAAAAHDGREALEAYAGPVLIVSGELDSILPAETQAESLEHGAGRQVVVAGVGHDLAIEAPDRLAALCDEVRC